jgi:AcrR family transcriptional regulator
VPDAPTTKRSPGRPRLESVEERRARLLDAAVELFGEASSQEASLNAIARATGIAKPSIYELFASRDALFEAAVARELDRVVDHVLTAYRTAEGSPRARTEARVGAIFDYAAEHPLSVRLILAARHQGDPVTAALEEAARKQIAAALRDVLDQELAAMGLERSREDLSVIAAMLVDITASMALRVLDEDDWDPARVRRLVADFVFRGLA